MKNRILSSLERYLHKIKDKKAIVFFDHLTYKLYEDKVVPRSGMLSYFIILSIFPFAMALLNFLNITPLMDVEFIYMFLDYLPRESQGIFLKFINEINHASSPGLFSLSIIGGLWTASSAIRHLMKSINYAYDFDEKRNFVTMRIVSLIFTVALIVMIILLFLTQIFNQKIVAFISTYIYFNSETLNIIHNLSYAVPLTYMIIIFSALYKFSPSQNARRNLSYKHIVPGAVFSTLGIIAMTALYTLYVNNFSKYSLTYGSIAGIIITLIWFYLLSIIILVGGELNATIYYVQNNISTSPRKKSMINILIQRIQKLNKVP